MTFWVDFAQFSRSSILSEFPENFFNLVSLLSSTFLNFIKFVKGKIALNLFYRTKNYRSMSFALSWFACEVFNALLDYEDCEAQNKIFWGIFM